MKQEWLKVDLSSGKNPGIYSKKNGEFRIEKETKQQEFKIDFSGLKGDKKWTK